MGAYVSRGLFVLFAGYAFIGKLIFGTSLVFMMFSLGLSFREILLSVHALDIELHDMEGTNSGE